MKYKDMVLYHQVFDLDNRRTEKFVTESYLSIMEFTYFYSGKDIRTHITPVLRRDIQDYFCVNPLDIEGYILEWCRDKSVETIEM
jgi:hypothetical protein